MRIIFICLFVLGINHLLLAQCGFSAGSDEEFCFHELPINLPLYADTEWAGEGITPSGLFNPSSPGEYVLSLVTNSLSCSDSDEKIITVLSPPDVNAGTDQIICLGDSYPIAALASSENGNITVFSWSGNDQFLSSTNISNPIATPTSTASFNLTVVDEEGCFSFDQITIDVASLPSVEAGSNIDICHTSEVIGLTGSPLGGSWSGPGISVNSFQSPGIGTHTLQYTYADNQGCENSDQLQINVSPLPLVDAGVSESICENEGPVELTDEIPSGGAWSGTGVINGTSTFNPSGLSGIIEVSYTIGQNTCEVSDSKFIEVNEAPEVTALSSYDICQNDAGSLDQFSPSGGTWLDGLVTSSSGEIETTSVVSNVSSKYIYENPLNGCKDTAHTVVHIRGIPEAIFTLEEMGCINTAVSLENNSNTSLNSSWFVDGEEVSNDFNPAINLAEEGTHDVSLIVQNEYGCEGHSALQSIEIITPPSADFNMDVDEGCEPLTVMFTNNSSGLEANYNWDFSLSNSSLENPGSINFGDVTENTDFTVSLTVTNECGVDQVTSSVYVKALPEADFYTELSSICSPVTTEFFNESSGSITSFEWDLGNGDITSDEVPESRVYTTELASQTYTVSLTATNECGTHVKEEDIDIIPNPVSANFSPSFTEACAPVELEIINSSVGGTLVTYDFGMEQVLAENVNRMFDEAGDYLIRQYVTDGCGYDTTETVITIHPEPMVEFSLPSNGICEGDQLDLVITGEDLTNFQWVIESVGTSIESAPSIMFEEDGLKEISLTASTVQHNCDVVFLNELAVHPLPELNFSLNSEEGCEPFNLEINDQSTFTDFYTWRLNDQLNTNSSPSFELTEPGIFDLEVSLSTVHGCTVDGIYPSIFTLHEKPEADFSFTPDEGHILSKPEIRFIPSENGITNFYWDFGDGYDSYETSPTHIYTTADLFPVKLEVQNQYGCSNELVKGVLIKDEITIYIPNSFSPNNDGVNEVFKPVIEGSSYVNYQFSVYNRWGQQVFYTNDITEGWNGSMEEGSHYVSNGAYTWEIKLLLQDGKGTILKNGTIQVFR